MRAQKLGRPKARRFEIYWKRRDCLPLIGYARVSKPDQQDNHAQVQELKRAGCKRIYQENASGGRWDRPELHKALEQLREDDVLVVDRVYCFFVQSESFCTSSCGYF
jgi:predicted site-specific integrase-resolvase